MKAPEIYKAIIAVLIAIFITVSINSWYVGKFNGTMIALSVYFILYYINLIFSKP